MKRWTERFRMTVSTHETTQVMGHDGWSFVVGPKSLSYQVSWVCRTVVRTHGVERTWRGSQGNSVSLCPCINRSRLVLLPTYRHWLSTPPPATHPRHESSETSSRQQVPVFPGPSIRSVHSVKTGGKGRSGSNQFLQEVLSFEKNLVLRCIPGPLTLYRFYSSQWSTN